MLRILIFVTALCISAPSIGNENRYREQAARDAIAEMYKSMEGVRNEAMAAGGLGRALEVCATIIPALAAAKRAAMDSIDVSRTSLHVLNPANAPDTWERQALESFAAKAARGENLRTMEYGEAVEAQGGARMFRFIKPLIAEPHCLECHGQAVSPDIANKRRTLFPQGQVAPWTPSGLAGAFSVRQPM
ncbi:MAG: DUF3365 domain-containing protein [Alphaproteobacteria bacterium]|nr:DUF3365 domain-containing protein [Alphaproteobacteria bacterium]